jgi:hypothetical protein
MLKTTFVAEIKGKLLTRTDDERTQPDPVTLTTCDIVDRRVPRHDFTVPSETVLSSFLSRPLKRRDELPREPRMVWATPLLSFQRTIDNVSNTRTADTETMVYLPPEILLNMSVQLHVPPRLFYAGLRNGLERISTLHIDLAAQIDSIVSSG